MLSICDAGRRTNEETRGIISAVLQAMLDHDPTSSDQAFIACFRGKIALQVSGSLCSVLYKEQIIEGYVGSECLASFSAGARLISSVGNDNYVIRHDFTQVPRRDQDWRQTR